MLPDRALAVVQERFGRASVYVALQRTCRLNLGIYVAPGRRRRGHPGGTNAIAEGVAGDVHSLHGVATSLELVFSGS